MRLKEQNNLNASKHELRIGNSFSINVGQAFSSKLHDVHVLILSQCVEMSSCLFHVH